MILKYIVEVNILLNETLDLLPESLAYLTAATNGLEEEADALKTSFEDAERVPDLYPGATLLQPPPPITQQESNWPLLTMTKGIFERAGVEQTKMTAVDMDVEVGEAGAGWGDDDLGLDDGKSWVSVTHTCI